MRKRWLGQQTLPNTVLIYAQFLGFIAQAAKAELQEFRCLCFGIIHLGQGVLDDLPFHILQHRIQSSCKEGRLILRSHKKGRCLWLRHRLFRS